MSLLHIVLSGSFLLMTVSSVGQETKGVWKFEDSNYELVFDFGKIEFYVDTIEDYHGNLYLITFKDYNQCYIRINLIFSSTSFTCCDKEEYTELKSFKKDGVIDRRGIVRGSNLYWRSIRDHNIDVIYNFCPTDIQSKFDRIFDSLIPKLKSY